MEYNPKEFLKQTFESAELMSYFLGLQDLTNSAIIRGLSTEQVASALASYTNHIVQMSPDPVLLAEVSASQIKKPL